VALPKWFWERVEQRPDDAAAPAPAGSDSAAPDDDIRLAWPKDGPPLFEPLAGKLLLEILRREAFAHGKVSIRHLARRTGIPKSSLSGRLRGLVDQGLVSLDGLAKLVNVSAGD
jgi:DNA-binding transcriptional ArsR family regulator